MDALFNNPIAQMYGPYFVLFYSTFIGVTLVISTYLLRDKTASVPLPSIQEKPDPYEIAYLRGGEKEVLKLVTVSLIQLGYLEIRNNQIQQIPTHPNLHSLKPLEKKIFDYFLIGKNVQELIHNQSAPQEISNECLSYQKWLTEEQLLTTPQDRSTTNQIITIVVAIILSLGIYKLVSALSQGHNNVGNLTTIMVFVAISWLTYICDLPQQRLTSRGQTYLQQLKNAFAQLNPTFPTPPTQQGYNSLLLLSIFGGEALASTTNSEYAKVIYPVISYSGKKTSSTGGGCGSSCGGGCGGCGGCGG